MRTLDFLEQDYNLRPTPIRAMRDKHQFDYGNAQSPTKRLSTRTPRKRKESSSMVENILLDESPRQEPNIEAVARPQLDKFRSSKLVLVDVLSWIISVCVLVAISIYQLFSRIFRRSGNDFEPRPNPIPAKIYAGLTNFIAVKDLSTAVRNPVASIKSGLSWVKDMGLAALISSKTLFKSPKANYHLKNLILSLGLGVLCVALLINFRYTPRVTHPPPQSLETDYGLKIDGNGCTSDGCLVNPELYKKLETMARSDSAFELKSLVDKLHILQMQVDMQQELIDQQLHSLSNEIYARVDDSITSKLSSLKQDLEVELDSLKVLAIPVLENNGPDYSLGSGGASISSHSPSFHSSTTPHTLLESSRNPGECWGMKGKSELIPGHSGFVEIALARKIVPKLVVIRHADKSSLYKDGYKSAPRDVEVLHSKEILGKIVVDPETAKGELVLGNSLPVDKLMVRILSNWGNDDWTCIYKIEVYGVEV